LDEKNAGMMSHHSCTHCLALPQGEAKLFGLLFQKGGCEKDLKQLLMCDRERLAALSVTA